MSGGQPVDRQTISGRAAIKMFREMFGIEQPGIKEMTIHARFDDVCWIQVDSVVQVGKGLIYHAECDHKIESKSTRRFVIEVREVT